ncbi:hypothetical protein F5X68DRAFT_266878 [Plectosphaerella plurivora]|uniref:Zn(2)-C6 fungal-type domain-containing protein n=1 Tax=Plectosphaerella plurivora TaxID=936078 RepID=A0A9P9AFQ3_9PEZI|nr:hypothetical protein F5X68DRAFT_266878 [Plectosphaerella plurivora]
MSRSKDGCITCRIRRVKCDEKKPSCQKCLTSKRKCDGYLSPDVRMSRRELAAAIKMTGSSMTRALSQIPSRLDLQTRELSPGDARLFEFFRRVIVPDTTNNLPSNFWQRDVMQLAHTEPAFWHATVALGRLHKCTWTEVEASGNRATHETVERQATKHYIQAMSLAKRLDSLPKYVILSIVLSATAGMLGRWNDMQAHVLSGLRILVAEAPRLDRVKMLGAAILRMDLQAMTAYKDVSQPYPYHTSRALFDVEAFLLTPCVPGQSIENVGSDLKAIGRAFFLLDDGLLSGFVPYGPWLTKVEGVRRRLVAWERRMAALEASLLPSQADEQAILCLRLGHVMLRTLSTAGPPGPESRFDRLLGFWEYAVNLAASILARIKQRSQRSAFPGLSLETGILLPLQVITHRCRHHSLRHAALKILAESNTVESFWRSDVTFKMQQAVVAVEEESVGPVSAPPFTPTLVDMSTPGIAWDNWSQDGFCPATALHWRDQPMIPEMARLKDVQSTTSFEKRCVDLSLVMCGENKEPNGGLRKIRVTY